MSKGPVIVRKNEDPLPTETLRRIEEMLRTVRYGSITLLIQDGKILQIDKTEKFRLNKHS
jgi:hypothetical protein